MGVKPGYKQTELGVLPADWAMSRLGAHANFRTGPFGSALHRTDYVDNGIPVINPMQIVDGKLVPTATMAVSAAAARKLSDFQLNPGDVIIGRRGEMGRCAVVAPEQRDWLCGTGSMIVRPKSSLNAGFAQRVLSSAPSVRAIENTSVGSTMVNLNQATLSNLLIPLPPTLAEQEAIAEALSDADALHASLEQLIAKKRLIKQGAMQELLTGQKRLPGFEDRWAQVSLGELFTFKNGLNKAKAFFGHGTPIVNYMDVYRSPTITSSEIPGRVSLTTQELIAFDVRKGDVFFTRTSETPDEIGMASVVMDEPSQTAFSGFVLRGRPKDQRLLNSFKAYCFRSNHVRTQIVSKASYTTRALTNGKILSAVVLPVPSEEEQAAIATIISDMDAETDALEAKLVKARQIKQGMMQELLTGRIRLV